jgi:hypothetical protein
MNPAKGLEARQTRGQRDHRDDEYACDVLGAAVAVGVTPCRGSPAERERDPEWHGGERVGDVMDRVGEERH